MNVGQRSMMNSKTAMQTVSHNVANKETDGYSRQRIEVQSSFAHGTGRLRVGSGSRTAAVKRTNNPYLERQLANERSQLAFYEGQASGLGRLEQVYNELAVEGLNHSLVNFFNSFKELSTNPESMARRVSVKENADLLSRDFHRVSEQIQEVRGDANSGVATAVEQINAITDEMAHLNGLISKVEVGGGHANDERDRRETLLKELGELIDIRWSEGKDSNITVSSANNAILVVNGEARRLEALATPATENKAEGDYDVLYYHHEFADPMVMTDRIDGGRLGGLLKTRDGEVKDYMDKVDMMAYSIAEGVNQIHHQGYNAFNQRGKELFTLPSQQEGAASMMAVNPEVMGDVGQIAAALDPNSPGDNRVAMMIGELQHKKALFDGATSIDEFYNGLIAEIGVRTNKANRQMEVQEGMVAQLQNLRDSISGVSIDEEMAQMMEWQKQFDASARVIRAADEMMETVMSIKS